MRTRLVSQSAKARRLNIGRRRDNAVFFFFFRPSLLPSALHCGRLRPALAPLARLHPQTTRSFLQARERERMVPLLTLIEPRFLLSSLSLSSVVRPLLSSPVISRTVALPLCQGSAQRNVPARGSTILHCAVGVYHDSVQLRSKVRRVLPPPPPPSASAHLPTQWAGMLSTASSRARFGMWGMGESKTSAATSLALTAHHAGRCVQTAQCGRRSRAHLRRRPFQRRPCARWGAARRSARRRGGRVARRTQKAEAEEEHRSSCRSDTGSDSGGGGFDTHTL